MKVIRNIFLIVVVLLTVFSLSAKSQERIIIHRPQAGMGLPGLLRPFKPDCTKYIIEVHPGWLIREICGASDIKELNVLECVDPSDTLHLFMRVISYKEPSDTLADSTWTSLKREMLESYGNRKIGVKVLSETDSVTQHPKNGILAFQEFLAKQPDHLDYIAQIITRNETILLSAPLLEQEYNERITYFRKIVADLKVTSNK